MTADEFLGDPRYGHPPIRDIADIVKKWDRERGGKPCDDSFGMATMLTVLGIDALTGDGLLNEISPELLDAMTHLMGEKADTYDEARKIIAEKLSHGDSAFNGFVSKIKGQIGEDRFIRENPEFHLALDKSQEGVDAIREAGDGLVDAVQVKMYADAERVVEHMLVVHRKVSEGLLVEGDIVGRLSFAVPENIAAAVEEKAKLHPELADINLFPVHTTAGKVAAVVTDAGQTIEHPLSHLGHEVVDSLAFMVALDALTNAFFIANGTKSIGEVAQETVLKTTIGAAAIAMSKSTALLLAKMGAASNPIVIPILSAIATRKLAQGWYDQRLKFSAYLKNEADWLSLLSTGILNRGRNTLDAQTA